MEVLFTERDAFLRFVRARVESDSAAEDILQEAFLRSLEHHGEIRDEESATAWFYRILRNAVVDHYRRRDVAGRAAERIAAEMPEAIEEVPADERHRVCECVMALASSLKPEYAKLLEQIDVEERSLGEVAEEEGITTNNATVRLHRARQALKKRVEDTCKSCSKHGCVDCTCRH